MRATTSERVLLLAHPLVTGSLAAVAVNDHLLKSWSGGLPGATGDVARLATGKASDVAGVLFVALVLGLVSGRRREPLATVATAFAALKLSSAVAAGAAPLLGGVTRTDATDLVALAALWPAHRFLAAADRGTRTPRPTRPGAATARAAGPALTALVLLLAVPTVTATSCLEPTQVAALGIGGDRALYAWITPPGDAGAATAAVDRTTTTTSTTAPATPGTGQRQTTTPDPPTDPPRDGQWARSVDGGWTWERSEIPADAGRIVRSQPTERVRAEDGTWYAVDGTTVTEQQGEGSPRTSFAFSDEERARLQARSDGCSASPQLDDFPTVVVTDGVVVVSAGSQGVIRREGRGDWERVAVLDRTPLSTDGPRWFAALWQSPWVVALLAPFLIAVSRLRSRQLLPGVVAAIFAFLGAVVVGAVVVWDRFNGTDYAVGGPRTALLSVAVFATSLAVAFFWRPPRAGPRPMPGYDGGDRWPGS